MATCPHLSLALVLCLLNYYSDLVAGFLLSLIHM